jgi:hypothetical protein
MENPVLGARLSSESMPVTCTVVPVWERVPEATLKRAATRSPLAWAAVVAL